MDWSNDKNKTLAELASLLTCILISFLTAVFLWRSFMFRGFWVEYHVMICLIGVLGGIFLIKLILFIASGWAPGFNLRIIFLWIFLLVLTIPVLYLPNYSPDFIWQTDHRTAQSMWVLPFSKARLMFHLQEEFDGIKVDLLFYPQFNKLPIRPSCYTQEEEKLRAFIQRQIIATSGYFGEKRIKQLRGILEDLPTGLDGEFTWTIATVESNSAV